ncbi:hypothetical protein FFI94_025170 [Rhodococcus sp. KBS0724]|jgi:hypothetical protein|uniref:hypothetical protein n=1 Tax=Rhodococcus sp. KBS0724 TaxID=1179674 RepID=UPI00110F0568|nr:hypothetical protein [Rhodococcus sp. KBS0724]TSD49103.1 hypothetical protein FFI94_025170 [Rhodococcus sp. KBS0724]
MTVRPKHHSLVAAMYSLALSLLILGPLLGPGYLLLRDAVSTPRSYLTDSALGLTDAAARAVPQDALIAALSTFVDGGLVVKALLLAALWLAGWGAARLVAIVLPTAGLGPQLVASTVMLWNPYVAERLLQGHWSLLAGYGALPWIVIAGIGVRRAQPGAWWAVAATLAFAGLTPTGALLGLTTALVVVASPGGRTSVLRRVSGVFALFLITASPWLAATFLSSGAADGSDPAGVAAFAARAEPGLGTLGSLAGLGGVWNSAAVPNSRTTLFAVLGTLLLLTVVLSGIPALWRRRRNPVISALAVLALVAVLAPALGATSWGLSAGRWSVEYFSGAGLLRDSQKWVALAAPFYALSAAAGVMWAQNRFTLARPTWSIAAVVVTMMALPDLAWGVGGALKPVQYPQSWTTVAEQLRDETGDVAVLPAGMFRAFSYTGDAPVLDPAPRFLPLDVLQTGELIVAGGSVGGEGTRAAQVEELLLTGASSTELAALGVSWILVELDTPGRSGEAALHNLERVFADDYLELYRVPGDSATHQASTSSRTIVTLAHIAWVATGIVALLALGLNQNRIRLARRDKP